MLEMRPNCEACDKDLPADAAGAMICSFECTWCADCSAGELNGHCPHCGGALHARPARSLANLVRFPASTQRKHWTRPAS